MSSEIWLIIGSGNGLSPVWCQVFTWTNADSSPIRPPRTYFNEILIEIQAYSYKNIKLKVLSAKWWSFCSGVAGLNVYRNQVVII